MKTILLLLTFALMTQTSILVEVTKTSTLSDWKIINDVVMGGRSSANFILSPEGHAIFSGEVSTENNGGFSSVRYPLKDPKIGTYKIAILHLKGDGKTYQFRVKAKQQDYYSYIATFETNNEWQKIEINLQEMTPSFRGRKLPQANFNGERIEEIAFLIGNKKNEPFKLLIDKIELKK